MSVPHAAATTEGRARMETIASADATMASFANQLISLMWPFDFFELSHECHVSDVLSAIRRKRDNTPRFYAARDIVMAYAMMRNTSVQSENISYDDMYTPYQRLLLMSLRQLSRMNCRRLNADCYTQRHSACGHPIPSWERWCTTKEFIINYAIPMMTEDTCLAVLDNIIDTVARHLNESEYVHEYPPLRTTNTLVGFTNGVYDLTRMCFISYEDMEATDASHDLSASHDVECAFRIECGAETEIAESLEKIGISHDLHAWFFGFIGRMLYSINSMDSWQVMPFFHAKNVSDILVADMFVEILSKLMGSSSVVMVGSSQNPCFALENIMNARVACLLMRDAPPIDQCDWESAVCGETVCVNSSSKGRTSYSHIWTTHLFGVGAFIPFKNDACTVERRIVMFDMKCATKEGIEAMRDTFVANLDAVLHYANKNFVALTQEYAKRDIWSDGVLPKKLHDLSATLKDIANPLLSFVNSEFFELNNSYYMPLAEFKDMYFDYRRRMRLSNQRWCREHYAVTFGQIGACIQRGHRMYAGIKQNTEWLLGVRPIHTDSINVTQGLLDSLKHEEMRIERELDAAKKRYMSASRILEIDAMMKTLKTERASLQKEYQASNLNVMFQ